MSRLPRYGVRSSVRNAGMGIASVAIVLFAWAPSAEAAVTYRASAATCNATANSSVSVPAGTTNGDVMLMVINSKDNAVQATPSGWTRIGTQLNNGSSLTTSIFYRVANNEPASYSPSTTAVSHCLGISSFSGADTSSPINASSQRANPSSTTVTANAITPSVADTQVVFISGYGNDITHSGYSGTNPTFIERYDVNTSQGTDNAIALASGGKTDTTSTGNRTANATSPAAVNNGYLVAIAPAAAATISISGTCKQHDNATDCTDTGTIRVAVNGTLQAQTQATVAGAWTISGVTVSSGQVVTVFIDGVASSEQRAVAVTTYGGSGNIAGLELIEGTLSLGSSENRTITNADIAQYDNSVSGDADVFDEVNAGNDLTVDSNTSIAGELLYVKSGNTYRPDSASSGLVTTHDLENRGTLQADGNTITLTGSWKNSSTFTAGTSLVAFDSAATSTLSGTLSGTSAFNKVSFTGGGAWTIQNAMKVSAANATDTFVIKNGAVTLGDSSGDNLEVNGKLVIAGTAGETGTLQTPALVEGSTITIDINSNASTPTCANCIISVGASSGSGTGNLKLKKNTILRLNPRSAATASDTGVEVQSTGYLEVLGSQEATNTVASVSQSTSNTTITVAGSPFTSGQFDGMAVRFTTVGAPSFGKIYTASSTATSSITITATASPTDTNAQVRGADTACSGSGNCTIDIADSLITANGQSVGSYLHNITDDKYYRIASSTEAATDAVRIITNSPDAFTTMDDGDDVEITDGIRAGDTFEVIDYAHVTAESGTACTSSAGQAGEAYINAKSGSETLIRYADICNLGRGATGKFGVTFESVLGSNENEGVTVDDSRVRKGARGIIFTNSSGNSGAKGIINNAIEGNLDVGLYLNGSSANTLSGNQSSNNGIGIFLELNNNRNTISNNAVSRSIAHGVVIEGSSGNTLTGNSVFHNGTVYETHQGLIVANGANNNIIDGNNLFDNITWGTIVGDSSSNNTISNNRAHNNRKSGLVIDEHDNAVFGNTSFNNGFHGMTQICPTADNLNTILFNNSFFLNEKFGLMLESGFDCLATVIHDNYGGLGANAFADLSMIAAGSPMPGDHKMVLYDTTLASPTEANFSEMAGNADSYAISKKHDGVGGATQIWGKYTVPADDAETPQNESAAAYNYARNLWGKSATPHGYSGTGSEDSNLNYDLSTADLSAGPYHYRATVKTAGTANCATPAVLDVFRNNVDVGDAICGSTFTDSTTNVSFKIDGGATGYAVGDSYTFVVWDASSDTNTQKTVNMMQDKDTFTVPSPRTLELKGQSTSTNPTLISRGASGGYQFSISGTLDASGYRFDHLGGTGQSAGLLLNSGATITSLGGGSFDNFGVGSGASDAFVQVASSLIGSSTPALLVSGINFANTGSNAECNLNAVGSAAGYWEFQSFAGAFSGETNDCQNGVADPDPGNFLWTP